MTTCSPADHRKRVCHARVQSRLSGHLRNLYKHFWLEGELKRSFPTAAIESTANFEPGDTIVRGTLTSGLRPRFASAVKSETAEQPALRVLYPRSYDGCRPRASLEVLRVDYEDYLRVRDLRLWSKDSREAHYIRNLGRAADLSFETYRNFCETRSAEVIANIALCLIHQTNYLLDQQIRRLEADFVKKGGIRERMTQARLAHRKKQSGY